MTTHNGWRSARGHIVFLVALISAFAVVYALEQLETKGTPAATWEANPETPAPPPPYETLSPKQQDDARYAWAYFEGNTQPASGLVNSVAGYSATTMWDTGSYLLAAIAAERLGFVPREEFDRRMSQALDSLAALPLYDGRLPNKSYDTRTLEMTDYANTPMAAGIGWSALDIGRLLVPLEVLLTHATGFAEVWYGEIGEARFEITTDAVVRTESAKEVTAGKRLYGYVDGDLLYAYDMAAMGQSLQPHIWARLQRAEG